MSAGREALAWGEPKERHVTIAVTELLNGKNVDWLEKVTEEQYLAGPQNK